MGQAGSDRREQFCSWTVENKETQEPIQALGAKAMALAMEGSALKYARKSLNLKGLTELQIYAWLCSTAHRSHLGNWARVLILEERSNMAAPAASNTRGGGPPDVAAPTAQ